MTAKKHRLLVGAHMSIAGGFEKAITRGLSIGCTAIQIFTKSNRQWAAKKISEQEADLFKKTAQDSIIGLKNVIAHASYLINLGSGNHETYKKSITALINELERCSLLGIPYLVLHPGSYSQYTEKEALKGAAQALDEVLAAASGKTVLLLETMAGQGTSLCSTFEQLAYLYQQSSHKRRLGICVDTCHIFAAGYDLRTEKAYETTWTTFEDIIGLNILHAIHINDSKKELGSRVDRHEDIGKGKLGLEAFRLLFNDERFFDIPKVLETPETTKDPLQDYARNLETIRTLISDKTRKKLEIEENF